MFEPWSGAFRKLQPMEYAVISAIKEISIGQCENGREAYLAAYFTDGERGAAQGRPAQSIAGICAVKQALAALCRSLCTEGIFREKAFEIVHTPDGAPRIGRFPDFSVGNRTYTKETFSISISHTRATAYGLAVVQERIDGRRTHPV